MDELQKRVPVFAAMSAMDDAVAAHKLVSERLSGAMEEGERLDVELRRAGSDEERAAAAQKLSLAVGLVQQLASMETRARLEVRRAQAALDDVRRGDHRAHLERMRVELEIDAASIWDLVGQFEAQMRVRLEQHAAIAAEMAFAAKAAGAPQLAAPATDMWTPALGTSGPELLTALATGVRQLQAKNAEAPTPIARVLPDNGIKTVTGKRVAPEPKKAVSAEAPTDPPPFHFGVDKKSTPPPPAVVRPLPPPPPEPPRGRLERALNAIGRVLDSKPAPPPAKKSVR